MSQVAWLVIYCCVIMATSLLGGYLPFLGHVTHGRIQVYLSLAAGVMLGAAFFHVMPEAVELSGPLFGWWMALGAVGLFCIERFIAPHSHEVNGGKHPAHHDHHDHAHDVKVLDHLHHEFEKGNGHAHEPHAVAPPVAGWMAVVGLTIHTFMNGVGLAGEVQVETSKALFPGVAIFLAIWLHKPADALAISTVLSRRGTGRNLITLVQVGFAAMIPIGVVIFRMTHGAIAEGLESQLTGAALAFSAGTFLFIALSDLLPEVQFHSHDRLRLFLALVLGVVGMGGIALLEPQHEHGSHGHNGHVDQADAGNGHGLDHE
jgi:zinc and cadmium transporter